MQVPQERLNEIDHYMVKLLNHDDVEDKIMAQLRRRLEAVRLDVVELMLERYPSKSGRKILERHRQELRPA